MSNPDRNAAIWYVDDGYRPEKKGINGRRVAGASFLKGFFDHADVSEFVSLTKGGAAAQSFAELAKDHPRDMPVRHVFAHQAQKMMPVSTLYHPSPNFADQTWNRQNLGATAYAICGITHTTATKAIMRGMLDLRASPQREWDAVICTSHAVQRATRRNIEIADAALKMRFGRVPPLPLMPVIPLGIDTAQFTADAQARATLRTRMNLSEKDIVITTLSRLIPYGKFDPAPLFIALQDAQNALGQEKRLHFIACGMYPEDYSKSVFEECAALLMPDVSFTHMDGADAQARKETLSGGDIFTFPIDNIQETFGLAPIEAMAAGMPVVVSDWDGMRDTVTEDVGFRIPTRTVQARATISEARGYQSDALSYQQYGARLSAMTSIDLRQMAEAFVTLARNDELRRKMGQAAQKRARTVYDWAQVIPQMQDLWEEQARIRKAARPMRPGPNPAGALPMDIFASYPGQAAPSQTERFRPRSSSVSLKQIYATRRIRQAGQPFEPLDRLTSVLEQVAQADTDGITILGLVKHTKMNPIVVERCILFLLKFGLIESCDAP